MFNEQTVPSDVVFIILALLGKGNRAPASKNFLYESFFKLSSNFTEIFDGFIFQKKDDSLNCELLDSVFNRIIRGNMVEWRPLGSNDFIIMPALVSKGKQLMQLFSVAERIQLVKAGEKFSEMINHRYEEKCG